MRIQRDIDDITGDDLFAYIEEQIIADVEKNSGRKIKPKDIKPGFRYTNTKQAQKNSRMAPVMITIQKWDYGKCYSTKAESAGEYSMVTYTVSDTPKGIHIIVDQYISEYEKKKESMGKIKRGLYEVTQGGALNRALNNLTDPVIRQKKGLIEPKEMPGANLMKKLSDKTVEHIEERNEKKRK